MMEVIILIYFANVLVISWWLLIITTNNSLATSSTDWLEVPTIYKAYFSGPNFRGYTPNSYGQKYGTFTYLHKLDPGIPIQVGE
jgi:hypothetical protein